MDLFEHEFEKEKLKEAPLAARMRPKTLDEFVGQAHIVGKGRVLRMAIESGNLPSLILWGPPGSGKTTLANIIANSTSSHFSLISAVSAGVTELRKTIEEAKERRIMMRKRTILFIDEIHRFNKAQQDAILPFVEDGTVTLIGATTENPSFEVISPLLSRSQLFILKPLSKEEIKLIILRATRDTLRGLGVYKVEIEDDALDYLITMCNNDARAALNTLETATLVTAPNAEGKRKIVLSTIEDAVQHRALSYDKGGDRHFDTISALHKSMRGSDPNASLYWLGRMLEAGDDPLYIARRLVRFASEDVGMADPQALVVAMAAQQAIHFLGLPEGKLALAEAAVYLATAPKSNSLYKAYSAVEEEIKKGANEPVPLHLRNAVTSMMKDIGYGKGYKYAHDFEGHYVEQQNLPDSIKDKKFYHPSDQGNEQQIAERLQKWSADTSQNKDEKQENI
ncbi:MAG: replication-associated recombination protein A [Dehalococcoidales bacterium]